MIKQPHSHSLPSREKEPREGKFTVSPNPVWQFGRIDFGGPWCPEKLTPQELRNVIGKLGQLESQPWSQIDGDRNHLIRVDQIIKEARKRLLEIKMGDIDELYSLHLTGTQRLWGIRDRNVLRFLWWDPNHEICVCHKKHT